MGGEREPHSKEGMDGAETTGWGEWGAGVVCRLGEGERR